MISCGTSALLIVSFYFWMVVSKSSMLSIHLITVQICASQNSSCIGLEGGIGHQSKSMVRTSKPTSVLRPHKF